MTPNPPAPLYPLGGSVLGETPGSDLSANQHHDYPGYEGSPSKTFMIASVPRSGSTHFSTRLYAEGVFGLPLEYLNPKTSFGIRKRFGHGDLRYYWREVQKHRTSPNGVFSYKMFVDFYVKIADRRPEFLSEIRSSNVIFFTREDKISQAVSYARAVQTGLWFATNRQRAEPKYDFEFIRRQHRSILQQESIWESIFDVTGANPYRLGYSRLLADENAVMNDLAVYLGVNRDCTMTIDIPLLERQSDSLSQQWIQQYREDAERKKLTDLAGF